MLITKNSTMLGLLKLSLIAGLVAAFAEHDESKHHWNGSHAPSTSFLLSTSSLKSFSECESTTSSAIFSSSTSQPKSKLSHSLLSSTESALKKKHSKTSEVDTTITTVIFSTSTIYPTTVFNGSTLTVTETEPCSTVVSEITTTITSHADHHGSTSTKVAPTTEVKSTECPITTVILSTFTAHPTTVISGTTVTISEICSTFVSEISTTVVASHTSLHSGTGVDYSTEVTKTPRTAFSTIEVPTHSKAPTAQASSDLSGFHNTTIAPTGFQNHTSTNGGFLNSTAPTSSTITKPKTVTHAVTSCETEKHTSIETLTTVENGVEMSSVLTHISSLVHTSVYPSVETTLQTALCTETVCLQAPAESTNETEPASVPVVTGIPLQGESTGETPTQIASKSLSNEAEEENLTATSQEVITSKVPPRETFGPSSVSNPVAAAGEGEKNSEDQNGGTTPPDVSSFEGAGIAPTFSTILSLIAALVFFL